MPHSDCVFRWDFKFNSEPCQLVSMAPSLIEARTFWLQSGARYVLTWDQTARLPVIKQAAYAGCKSGRRACMRTWTLTRRQCCCATTV